MLNDMRHCEIHTASSPIFVSAVLAKSKPLAAASVDDSENDTAHRDANGCSESSTTEGNELGDGGVEERDPGPHAPSDLALVGPLSELLCHAVGLVTGAFPATRPSKPSHFHTKNPVCLVHGYRVSFPCPPLWRSAEDGAGEYEDPEHAAIDHISAKRSRARVARPHVHPR